MEENECFSIFFMWLQALQIFPPFFEVQNYKKNINKKRFNSEKVKWGHFNTWGGAKQ